MVYDPRPDIDGMPGMEGDPRTGMKRWNIIAVVREIGAIGVFRRMYLPLEMPADKDPVKDTSEFSDVVVNIYGKAYEFQGIEKIEPA